MGLREEPSDNSHIPRRAEMEEFYKTKVVTFMDGDVKKPGGMCNCCGSGPKTEPDWRGDPWYVYQAGICDSDGVFYGMLCEGCLEEIRHANEQRVVTERDEQAEIIRHLFEDDIDGMQTFMDDRI